jgi:hypothetical protein
MGSESAAGEHGLRAKAKKLCLDPQTPSSKGQEAVPRPAAAARGLRPRPVGPAQPGAPDPRSAGPAASAAIPRARAGSPAPDPVQRGPACLRELRARTPRRRAACTPARRRLVRARTSCLIPPPPPDDEYTHKTVSRTHENTLEVTYFINGTRLFYRAQRLILI